MITKNSQNFISNPIYPYLFKTSQNIVNPPIKPPPNKVPTAIGVTPKVDLYKAPDILPQIIFFYKLLKPCNSSSKNKFKVLPVK